jgi:cation:H+ antiporter
MIVLLLGSHFAVVSTTNLASNLGITPIIIGMLILGLGATIPELLFSIKSVQNNDDSLAVGDILGTVLADGTIVVGILALISPFYFPIRIIYVTGVFMVIASFLLFYFMKSGKTLTKKESFILFIFWLLFILVELSFGIF